MATFTIATELLIDGVWTDVTSDVRMGDGISITRGRSDEASRADPASCTLTLNNRDGKYSPRNPMSPYYGLIGRNTPIRVSAEDSVRFYGEVSTWPQRWDKTGRDVWSPLQAFGVLRRLEQGAAPLRSVMYRYMSSALSDVVAYWPCEDGEGATEFASQLSNGPKLRPNGAVNPAAYDGFKASDPLPTVASDAAWTGTVRPYTNTSMTQVSFLMYLPTTPARPGSAAAVRLNTTGDTSRWDLDVHPDGRLRLRVFNWDDVNIHDSGFMSEFSVNGDRVWVTLQLDHTTADIDWTLSVLEVGAATATTASDTISSMAVGRVARVSMNAYGATITDCAFGHVVVQNALSPVLDAVPLIAAYAGESATDRIERLCDEEGLTVTIVDGGYDSTPLGPQAPATLMDLLREAEASDMGILYEPRDTAGLGYRSRATMYAQDATLTLDYTAGTLSSIEPVDDDDATLNDVTVTRDGGSSTRIELSSGPLSVLSPPDGVGRYESEITVSIRDDSDLPNQASWRLHMGTVDESRYPVLGFELSGPAFTSDAELTAEALALDLGDRLVVSNPLTGVGPPDDIQQIAQGYTETITPFAWSIDVNCTPASVWDVAVWDDDAGVGEARYSTDGTTTTEDLDATETSIDVSTPTGPVWSDTDAPFDIVIGGERMTVWNVTGVGASQILDVSRSRNDVVKTHDSGAVVQLFHPAIYAL